MIQIHTLVSQSTCTYKVETPKSDTLFDPTSYLKGQMTKKINEIINELKRNETQVYGFVFYKFLKLRT